MKLKINGVLVVDGSTVTVSDTDDLVKVNLALRLARSILDKYPDVNLVEIERIVVPEES